MASNRHVCVHINRLHNIWLTEHPQSPQLAAGWGRLTLQTAAKNKNYTWRMWLLQLQSCGWDNLPSDLRAVTDTDAFKTRLKGVFWSCLLRDSYHAPGHRVGQCHKYWLTVLTEKEQERQKLTQCSSCSLPSCLVQRSVTFFIKLIIVIVITSLLLLSFCSPVFVLWSLFLISTFLFTLLHSFQPRICTNEMLCNHTWPTSTTIQHMQYFLKDSILHVRT